jgi:hypothetical protein
MTDTETRAPGTPILIGIGVAVALAIIVVLALSGRGLQKFDAASPEAAAQAYIQALFDEDFAEARGHLSDELQSRCRGVDLRISGLEDTATFDEVRLDGDHAEIELRLSESEIFPAEFPFRDYNWSTDTELELDRIDGVWRITRAAWPVFRCRSN